jgi:hypothetical protein
MAFASMVILEIDIKDVAALTVFEAEGQPPVAADRHREGPGPGACERMKPTNCAQIPTPVAPSIASSIKLMRCRNSAPMRRDRPVRKISSTPLCAKVLIDIENLV